MMLNRLCAVCGKTVPQGQRCECQKKRHKTYDREHRDKGRAAFYHSLAWTKLRNQIKVRACGSDEYVRMTECRMVPGTIAHHIYPVDEFPELKLKDDNLIYVSARTHEMIHVAYDRGGQCKAEMQGKLWAIALQLASQERF